jgi:hypothetical protein
VGVGACAAFSVPQSPIADSAATVHILKYALMVASFFSVDVAFFGLTPRASDRLCAVFAAANSAI